MWLWQVRRQEHVGGQTGRSNTSLTAVARGEQAPPALASGRLADHPLGGGERRTVVPGQQLYLGQEALGLEPELDEPFGRHPPPRPSTTALPT